MKNRERKSVFLGGVETHPLERGREKDVLHGCRGVLVTRAGGGSEFIPAHALQPGWRSKLGQPQWGESQNHSENKCYLQTCSPASAKCALGPGREGISKRQGWGKSPAGAEGRALLMLEKGKQLSQT